ncbi:thiopeptide-type bacteriocin biosynthesis protein [Kitasatospora sp. NPDC094015]|uniref:lantibiotic dehydratase n=1 Tax=Kitasatospora sp. NPDC094015 TaxID=3155205 RepID=UPI00331FAC58
MTDRTGPAAPRYRAAPVAVLRIPALPADRYGALLAACPPEDPRWPATHRALLADLRDDPLPAAAVEYAAPDLARALADPGAPADTRTALALDRCLNRLSTRPTPFGLAATVATADFGPHPRLELAGPPRPVARPDAAALADPAELGDRPVVVSDLVHTLDGHPWRESAGRGAARWLRGSAPLLAVLAAAARPVPPAALLAELDRRHPGQPAAARRLVRDLLRLGFLRPATGPGPAPAPLRELCAELNAAAPADALGRLRTALRAEPRPALHLDAVARPAAPLTLDPAVARYAEQAAGLLALVGRGSRYPRHLARAATAFTEHHGAHARVPALAAVHTLTDLRALDGDGPAPFDDRDDLLAGLVAEALARRQPVRELDDDLLARLTPGRPIDLDRPALPGADICLRIGHGPDGRVRAALGGPGAVPAGVAYGRLTDLLDGPARAALAAAVDAEEAAAPGHRFVELGYRPERAAAANVTARELRRGRQLPVDLEPAPGAPVLALAEVLVGVRDGRFELREAATGGLLHLTQGSGLDLRLAPPVCRFLLDASANQFRHPAPFDWGVAGRGPFRPRLERAGLVLSPACWQVGRADLGDCSAGRVRAWAADWLAPRYVHLVSAGRQLLLDLDSAVSLAHLRHALARAGAGRLLLQEAVPAPGTEPVTGPDGGRHTLEAVVPVTLTTPHPARPAAPQGHGSEAVAVARAGRPGVTTVPAGAVSAVALAELVCPGGEVVRMSAVDRTEGRSGVGAGHSVPPSAAVGPSGARAADGRSAGPAVPAADPEPAQPGSTMAPAAAASAVAAPELSCPGAALGASSAAVPSIHAPATDRPGGPSGAGAGHGVAPPAGLGPPEPSAAGAAPGGPPSPAPARGRVAAGLPPGRPSGEWVSLHLYLRGPWQDALLAELVPELPGVELFFVRYADPLEHLRIRVRHRPGRLEELLDLARACAGRLPVHEVAVREYRPEADRYGGPELLGAAERLFCADSAAVVRLLAGRPALPRAVLAALTLDRLAALLLPDPAERRAVAAGSADSRAGSAEHRRHGRELWRLRTDGGGPAAEVAALWAGPAAEYGRLLELHRPGPEGADRRRYALASVLHLHANRLGLDRARERTALGLWRRLLDREAATAGPAPPPEPAGPTGPAQHPPVQDPPAPAKEAAR